MTKKNKLTGQWSLFRHKQRRPLSLTLTPKHHRMVRAAMKRLKLTRADAVALLINQFAAVVERPDR